ncbi:MAG: glucosaminidase domain-containing protein [Saprospiraceae bacterium]
MRIISLTIILMFCLSIQAKDHSFLYQKNPVLTYIDKYNEIAQSEMQRLGIPASVKLAQGILESNSGRSALALKAKNHFGIKCGKYWEGPIFYREDDDYVNGELIKSCFRKFSSPEHSYKAHSDFLKNPGSHYRYGFLFDLNPLDYVSWAHGLKSSGYATDPRYADKLISVIEKYELYQYDQYKQISVDQETIAFTKPLEEEKIYNDLDQIKTAHTNTRLTLIVKNEYHLVKEKETMQSIARRYNVDLDLLYFQNRIPNGRQPKTGEKVIIEGIIHWGKKKPKVGKNFAQSKESYLFEDGSMTITIR